MKTEEIIIKTEAYYAIQNLRIQAQLRIKAFVRDKRLNKKESKKLHFWNDEILKNIEKSIKGEMELLIKDIPIYKKFLKNQLKGHSNAKKLEKDIDDTSKKSIVELQKKMDEYCHRKHIDPIINTVAHLPKDELAAMAESLVHLTALKRKITLKDTESVGGPIDVAVISKGDGFIWIKRKHYFTPDLNAQFLANYNSEL